MPTIRRRMCCFMKRNRWKEVQAFAAQHYSLENTQVEMVVELEEAACLPKGKELTFLYAEADGVFVRATEKKKSHEVRHAIIYEGWNKNGKRVSLQNPSVIMTTKSTDDQLLLVPFQHASRCFQPFDGSS
jgi:hypothetical protein